MDKIILLLGSIFTMLAGSVSTNFGKGSIAGNVTEHFINTKLEGAKVLLFKDKKVVASTTVKENGKFNLDNIPSGNYSLKIENYSYQPIHKNVSIKNGDKVTLDNVSLKLEDNVLDELVIDVKRK